MKIKRIVFTPLLEGGKPAVRPPTKGEEEYYARWGTAGEF